MAFYLALSADCTSVVSDTNPIQTKHSSLGEAVDKVVYLWNDGKRKNVPSDPVPTDPQLIYTNIKIKVEGVSSEMYGKNITDPAGTLALTDTVDDKTVRFKAVSGWNVGTILKAGNERMRIDKILVNDTTEFKCEVTRNYTADSKPSTLLTHNVGEVVTTDTSSVTLALPSPDDGTYATKGTFVASLDNGVNPSRLTQELTNGTTTTIKTNNGLKYTVGSLIKIENEIMKVTSASATDLSVVRAYGQDSSYAVAHPLNSVIYLYGLIDLKPNSFKFWVKNSPPPNLPTQKKKDVKIVVTADEEPLV